MASLSTLRETAVNALLPLAIAIEESPDTVLRFAGDPWRNAAIRAERYPSAREAQDRVWAFLDRNGEWEERINGGLSKTAQ